MKKFYYFLLVFVVSLVYINAAYSTTYYVNAATGNNGNSAVLARNIATPWQTVQHAIDNAAVVDGDNIVVSNGTYAGFVLSKRVTVIGAWKDSDPLGNTIFNSTVTLSAAGGSASSRMILKSLRVEVATGDAIDMRSSYVTLENVHASAPTPSGLNGLRVNRELLSDLLIEYCEFEDCTYSGIYFPTFAGLNGFVMRNSTVKNNGYFGIIAFQRRIDPTMIENVMISHCNFENNNPTNQVQGHTIYFEKLRNSVFENISVSMPPGNHRIGIDINLLAREDYSNIEIRNSRIFRSSPGSGIWIQARNDLFDPPAALTDVVLRGLTFDNCDTNVAFNRQVNNMVVDKCDMSTYLVYGLVNFTDQGGTIDASNNKWKGGVVPDTTVISGGLLVNGSNIISFMPSTSGIFLGMGIVGPGIPPGTIVTNKSPNTVTMSNNAFIDGFIPQIGFAFNFTPTTDLVRTSLNFIHYSNPMPNSIVNQNNVSFPDLASAISGTGPGGTIWNVPYGTISGTTVIDKELTLISPGAGFLHNPSRTTFENLSITGASSQFKMGSDFAVSGNLVLENLSASGTGGTPDSRILIGRDNTIVINGSIINTVNNGILTSAIKGGLQSDIYFGGTSAQIIIPRIIDGARSVTVNRANGVMLSDNVDIHRRVIMLNGLFNLAEHTLSIAALGDIHNPVPASYIETSSTGFLKKFYDYNSPTAFNFAIGKEGYTPVLVYFAQWTLAPGAYLTSRVLNTKHPYNNCYDDYLKRDWKIVPSGITDFITNNTFHYLSSDVVGTEINIYGAIWNGITWVTFTHVDIVNNTFSTDGLTVYGDFTGGAEYCINDFGTQINIKAYLQGAYSGGGNMRTDLLDEGVIPLSQPYGSSQYNYNGTEFVAAIPPGVVDWVYLEIRTSASGLAVANGKRAAFIKSDGTIVDLDGVSPVKVSVIPGDYFLVVGHRNHLPVMSKLAQPLNTASVQYNFTDNTDKYYGDQAALLAPGIYGAYAGDANKSFVISAADFTVVTLNLGQTNYNQGDLNMSAVVSAADYNLVTLNLGKLSNVPNYE